MIRTLLCACLHRRGQARLSASLLLALTAFHCSEGRSVAQRSAPSPQDSAGVFIGVEKFSHDFSLTDVRYAVNDAVDLAYALSLERGLLPANRVLLLLAGDPVGDSLERLEKLKAAGAKRQSARQADIYSLVEAQSRQVGERGILVLSISTHGFSQGGEHLLMAEDSLLQFGTGVTAANLLQATQARPGGLRLLLVDACQRQLVKSSRKGSGAEAVPDRRSAISTEFVKTLAQSPGYAVLSAASKDEEAFSGDGNGFFTGAILDGLRCQKGERAKTLRGLASFVAVEATRRSPGQQHAQLLIGGGVDDFVLFDCGPRLPPRTEPPPHPEISTATLEKIQDAENLLAVGGPDNVEQSFRLYREAFPKLSPAVLRTLNQGLLDRARQLDDDSWAHEGAQIYRQLLDPLTAQSHASHR